MRLFALFVVIMIAAVGVIVIVADNASAHRVTNQMCANAALAATRAEPPATREEYQRRYAACREWGAAHNARHAQLCNETRSAEYAIRCVFPSGAEDTAWRIAKCESTAHDMTPYPNHGIYAQNGQYVGLLQMGIDERRASGWYDRGSAPIVQARSTYRLYLERGWGPWRGYGCL